MGDNSNLPQKNSEEIDIIQLFGYFEQKIKNLFKGIISIFKWLFSVVIYSLKALQKNIKILGPLLIIALVFGGYLDKKENPEYSSEMLVQPYFEAKYQLYANLEYYNSLLKDEDFETLSDIFDIKLNQAEEIISFEMYPGPETDNQLRKEYFKFIEEITSEKTIDSKSEEVDSPRVLEVSFDEFVEGRSIYSSDKYIIKVISSKKDIFKYLEKGLNNSFKNEYSKRNRAKRDSVLNLKRLTIESSLKDIDSLQKVYVEAFKENAKAKSSQIKVSEQGFTLADNNIKTKEFELLTLKTKLNEELRGLEESKVIKDAFFDIMSSFPEIGKLEAVPFYNRKMILCPVIAFTLFILCLLFIKSYKFVEKYE